jgi:hypothetical protein
MKREGKYEENKKYTYIRRETINQFRQRNIPIKT